VLRSGVAVIDKPRGLTSHTVVAQARRLFGRKDVGHAGTLDPMATGVLLVLVGQACKLSGYLTADSKRYAAEIYFGSATDSLDADGQVTEERTLEPDQLSLDKVEAALAAERERLEQTPPAVSAIKVDGQRAYALTRRGEAPELPARPVQVLELRATELEPPRLRCELWVSKGYYVRSLARDLGERLGTVAHLSALRRLASGPFSLEQASPWPATTPPRLVSLSEAVSQVMPRCVLTDAAVPRARQGKRLEASDFIELPDGEGPGAWLSANGDLIAIGTHAGELKVLRGFNDEPG
jgi:tRNA pseudouridine55 synthase